MTVPSSGEAEAGTPDLLRHAADLAIAYRGSLAERRVGAASGLTADDLRRTLGGPLPERGEDPRSVVDALAAGVEPGLVTMASPRYFGFVIGGSAGPLTTVAARSASRSPTGPPRTTMATGRSRRSSAAWTPPGRPASRPAE